MSVQVSDPRYEILDTAAGPETPPYQFAKARDREEGRVVVLQMAPADVLGRDARARQEFQSAVREAQALDHPGILRVYGQGITEGGDFVCRPRTLAQASRSKSASGGSPLQPCRRYGHRSGHCRVPGRRAPGWGRSRRSAACPCPPQPRRPNQDCRLCLRRGRRKPCRGVGRAAFRAPELAGGESSYAGDIYALGATLYEMLTGVPPLAGAARVTSPRDVTPAFLPRLTVLVRKALAPDPRARYRSASALLADLQAIRDALRSGKSLAWSPQTERAGDSGVVKKGSEPKTEKRAPRPSAGDAALSVPREDVIAPAAGTASGGNHFRRRAGAG